MIKCITIDNFKSIQHASVDLPFFGALVGKNAAGKTNLINAIAFVQELARGTSVLQAQSEINFVPHELLNLNAQSNKVTLSIEVTARNSTTYLLTFEVELVTPNDVSPDRFRFTTESLSHRAAPERDYTLVYRRTGGTIHDSKGKQIPLNVKDDVLALALYKNPDADAVKDVLSNMVILTTRIDPDRDSMGSDKGTTKRLANLLVQLRRTKPDKFDSFIKIARRLIPTFKDISEIAFPPPAENGSEGTHYIVLFQERHLKERLSTRSLSEGDFRALFLIATALSTDHSILIVEELENGMQPMRTRILLEFLQSISQKLFLQILFTTHSPTVINCLSPHNIVHVTRDARKGTELTLLSKSEEISIIEKVLAEEGRITDYLETEIL